MAGQRHSLMNRLISGSALLILGFTLFVARWGFNSPLPKTSSPSASESKTTASDQRLIFAAGVVEGLAEPLEVQFEVSGRIRDVLVREGQRVRKDDILAEVDPQGFQLGVSLAEADLRTAQLQSQMFEPAPNNNSAVAANGAAGNSQGATRPVSVNRGGKTNEQLIAMSRVEAANLALQKEQLQLEKTRLRSPLDGTVVQCAMHPGELVGPQDRFSVFRIVDRTKTRVRAWVEELDAMDVRPGQSAAVVASGSVERKYRGTVISCANYVQPKSERHLNPGERVDIRVREIVVELKDGQELLLGLPVEVFIAPGRIGRSNAKTDQPTE